MVNIILKDSLYLKKTNFNQDFGSAFGSCGPGSRGKKLNLNENQDLPLSLYFETNQDSGSGSLTTSLPKMVIINDINLKDITHKFVFEFVYKGNIWLILS